MILPSSQKLSIAKLAPTTSQPKMAAIVSTIYIDRYDRADGSQYEVCRQRYICTNKAMKRGACGGQSAYVAHKIDGAVLVTLRDYLTKI